MDGTISNDLNWMMKLIEKHVPCNCYDLRLWRRCVGRAWCLRTVHLQRLKFFRDGLAFEFAMKGMAAVPPLVLARPERP